MVVGKASEANKIDVGSSEKRRLLVFDRMENFFNDALYFFVA